MDFGYTKYIAGTTLYIDFTKGATPVYAVVVVRRRQLQRALRWCDGVAVVLR